MGDLAGFVAATYQRGVPVVQVPTTLVAQVDSAYGGKTGVDLPEAKNYVGAYHQPAGVLADPAVLATLPPAERAAGFAEVLKTALIAGGALWERVAAGARDDDGVVLACARTKLAVVAEDERDGGRRQVLNLGHTVGHALETVTGYGRLRHGEAVGLGPAGRAAPVGARRPARPGRRAARPRRGCPWRCATAPPSTPTPSWRHRPRQEARGRRRRSASSSSTPPARCATASRSPAADLRRAVAELVGG